MIELPIHDVPFSAFRAWLSLAPATNEPEATVLILRTHHGRGKSLLRIEACAADAGMIQLEASPTHLRWTVGHAWIDVCFDQIGLRFKGHGLGLRITPVTWGHPLIAYRTQPDQIIFNPSESRQRYHLERLEGSLNTSGLAGAAPNEVMRIECPADQSWEIALDEFESTWTKRERLPFEQCLQNTQRCFTQWLDTTPPAACEYDATRVLAAYINWSSVVGVSAVIHNPVTLNTKNEHAQVGNCQPKIIRPKKPV
jgi:hypothetical protein